MMAVAKKDEGPTRNFWEGEWVCADCGYLYDIDDCGGLYLEEQVRLFLCSGRRGRGQPNVLIRRWIRSLQERVRIRVFRKRLVSAAVGRTDVNCALEGDKDLTPVAVEL